MAFPVEEQAPVMAAAPSSSCVAQTTKKTTSPGNNSNGVHYFTSSAELTNPAEECLRSTTMGKSDGRKFFGDRTAKKRRTVRFSKIVCVVNDNIDAPQNTDADACRRRRLHWQRTELAEIRCDCAELAMRYAGNVHYVESIERFFKPRRARKNPTLASLDDTAAAHFLAACGKNNGGCNGSDQYSMRGLEDMVCPKIELHRRWVVRNILSIQKYAKQRAAVSSHAKDDRLAMERLLSAASAQFSKHSCYLARKLAEGDRAEAERAY